MNDETKMSESKPAPIHKWRIGLVTASVWRNSNRFYTVTLSRSYKDGDDWKETNGFAHDDLLNVAMVMTRAEAWISAQ